MDTVVAHQNRGRNLPGAPAHDEFECEARLARAGGPTDQDCGVADLDRRGMDSRIPALCHSAGSLTTRALPAQAILRPNAPAMRVDDLLGDRQAEPRVLAKALVRPIGVEPLEHALQRVGTDSRSVVVDHDLDLRAHTAAEDAHLAAGLREGLG